MEIMLRLLESTICLTGPQMSTRSFSDTKTQSSLTIEDITDMTATTDIMDITVITDMTDITDITDITVITVITVMETTLLKDNSSPIFQPLLTGEFKVPLPQLRTKVAAVHAGPSPPLDPWKVPTSSRTRTSSPSPSNNLLTAPKRTRMLVAKWTHG